MRNDNFLAFSRMIALAVLLVAFMLPTPAHAHGFTLTNGKDRLRVQSDHSHMRVIDRECDGNGVYGVQAKKYWTGFHLKMYDRNGCKPGGTKVKIARSAKWVKVCEERWGMPDSCSPWHRL